MNFCIKLLTVALLAGSCAQKADPDLAYLKQKPPGIIPEIFAPGLISLDNEYEFGSVFNADVTEFFYGVDTGEKSEIRYSKLEHGEWTKPVTILSADRWGYNDPFLSPDEKRLYCISERPLDGTGDRKDYDIWYVERLPHGWSEPINAGPAINTESDEYYISFTKNGSMYFASGVNEGDFDIYYAPFTDGEFQPAIALSDSINTRNYEADVFIDPDEEYIIFCSEREDGFGRGDLYISFKNEDGTWSKSENMGKPVNSEGHELCPFVTKDGKYLFYTSKEDIYWVSTEVFDQP